MELVWLPSVCWTFYIVNYLPCVVFLVPLQLQEPLQHYVRLHLELVLEMMLHFSPQLFIRALDFEVALSYVCTTWYLRRELSLSLEASKKSSLLSVSWLLINLIIIKPQKHHQGSRLFESPPGYHRPRFRLRFSLDFGLLLCRLDHDYFLSELVTPQQHLNELYDYPK